MNFVKQVKPWWEILGRQATLKTETGVTAETPCHISRPPYRDRPHIQRFRFPTFGPGVVSELGLALLESGKVAEMCVDGVWYRVTLKTGMIGVDSTTARPMTIAESLQHNKGLELDAEPIPGREATGITASNAKPSVKEKVLGVLKSAPDGLSSREIGERIPDCSTRWVFSTLAGLVRVGNVEKRGGNYFIQNSPPVCG